MIKKILSLLFIVANCNGMNTASQLFQAIQNGDTSKALPLIHGNFNPKTYTVEYKNYQFGPLGHAIVRHGNKNKNGITINNLPIIQKIFRKELTTGDTSRGGILDEAFKIYNDITSNNLSLKKDFGTIISLLLKNEITFIDIEIDENDENYEERSIVVKSINKLCNDKIHRNQFDRATLQEFKEVLEDCTPEMFRSCGLNKFDIDAIVFGTMFKKVPQYNQIKDINLQYGNSKKREKETDYIYENKKPTKRIKK